MSGKEAQPKLPWGTVILFGVGISLSKISIATGTSPGCATQVPSWPFFTSRSLSARTLANTSSFFAASLVGMNAAMPPITYW